MEPEASLNRLPVILGIGLAIALVFTVPISLLTLRSAQAICGDEQGLNEMTVKASGHNVYLLWGSRLGGYFGNIHNYTLFFKKSKDDGVTFGPTMKLYSTSQKPCFSLFSQMEIGKNSKGGDNVYVAWNAGGMQFRASSDGGETFGNTISVDGGGFGTLFGPAIIDWGGQLTADSNNGVYIVTTIPDNLLTQSNLTLSSSIDGGKTFVTKTIGNSSNHHQTPQAAVSGRNVYLVWSEYSDCVGYQADNCHVKIMFAKSSNRGEDFNNPIVLASGARITNSTTSSFNVSNCFGSFFCGIPSHPSIQAVGSNVYVSWLYNSNETYFARSTDNGTNFSAPVRISEAIHQKGSNVYFDSPFMNAYDNGRVEVGWVLANGSAPFPGTYPELAVSKDSGGNFSQVHRLDVAGNFVVRNGTVYSVGTDQSSEHLVFTVASENRTAAKSTVLASNSTDYPGWFWGIAATDAGNAYVVWQNASSTMLPGELQPPLVLRSSSDGGVTFGSPRVIQEAMVIRGYDPYYGQQLTINWDSSIGHMDVYGNTTERASVSGYVAGNVTTNPLILSVFDPINQSYASYKIPDQNVTSGIYHYAVTLGEKLPRLYGSYMFKVSQIGQSAETSVSLLPRSSPPFAHVEVNGTSFNPSYSAHFANVLNMSANPASNQLITFVDAGRNASITIDVPRYLLDSTSENGADKNFAVTVNGTASNYVQTASDSTVRSLKILLSEGKSVIVIQGTHMIPEFNSGPTPTATIMALSLPIAAVLTILVLVRRRHSIGTHK